MQSFELDIIGTHLQILIDTSSSCNGDFSIIGEKLQDFEARFSRFIYGNWLYNVNKNRSGILDQDGQDMLSYMLNIAQKTDGYFDPTVGKRLTELGYGNPKLVYTYGGYKVQNSKGKQGFHNYRDIELVGDKVILHGDILLEFGGVGKGYLIDVIVRMLESSHVSILEHEQLQSNTQTFKHSNIRFLINFGGDLYGKGGWNIGLESPFAQDEIIGTITLDSHFLACSSGSKRKWGNYNHLIDPHTGESATDVVASYIEGISGMSTDAYATTLCVMPWELACRTLEITPEISGVIVSREGDIYQKEGSRAQVFN